MSQHNVLLRAIVTEKANTLMDDTNQYTFLVDKKANKLQIRKAVEKMYGVSVASVNTVVMPAKSKGRFTRTGFVKGRVSSFKKAIVTLDDGEYIDLYGDI